MSKDLYHDVVREALEKEGWLITHDPLGFSVGDATFRIDLGAENCLGAEKGSEKIAVEIKSFVENSPMHAFHEALGQYENYLLALELYEPERILFLAIPKRIYDTFFQKPFVQMVLKRKNIHLIIYTPIANTNIEWIR